MTAEKGLDSALLQLVEFKRHILLTSRGHPASHIHGRQTDAFPTGLTRSHLVLSVGQLCLFFCAEAQLWTMGGRDAALIGERRLEFLELMVG